MGLLLITLQNLDYKSLHKDQPAIRGSENEFHNMKSQFF